MLAITAKGSRSDAALAAGADDYLHRPFTRGELLARAGAGLRAARQRSDDRLMRALMLNVPGAIYRSAWHAGHVVELISDEIERIAGYLPSNFVASTRRTMLSIVHPDDRDGAGAGRRARRRARAVLRARVPDRARRRRGALGARSRPGRARGRAGGCGSTARCSTSPSAARPRRRCAEHEVEQARTEELRASRARIVEAADAARRRIERDLHDGAQQRLVLVSLTLKRAEARAKGTRRRGGPGRGLRAAARGAGRAARPRPRDPPGRARRARASAPRSTASSPAAPFPVDVRVRPSAPRRRSRPRSTSPSPRR